MDHAEDGDDVDVLVYMGGLVPQHLRETITHVRVHKSIKIIRSNTFRNCRHLISVEMHDGVEIIEEMAFCRCRSVRGIKLTGVRIIEKNAFYECISLADVEFGDKLETIGEFAFADSALRNIKLPKVRVIGKGAFAESQQLLEAELSKDLERIGDWAFHDCLRLRRIDVPLNGTLLGDDVFNNCHELSQVNLVGGIHKTVYSLLLESWRNEMKDEINRIHRYLPNTNRNEKTAAIRQWMGRVMRRLEHYKSEHYALLKKNMTQLELALWKANLQQQEEEEKEPEEQPAKKARLEEPLSAEIVDANLQNVETARQHARVTCGANLIIPHVLSFLNNEDEFPTLNNNS